MTAPTFTCDRCGRQGKGQDRTYRAPRGWQSVLGRMLCPSCQDAVRRDIDQLAGEGVGPSHSPESPSPVPAAPSLVERLRDIPKPDLLGTHSADCWQWHEHCARLEAADRIEELEAERIEYMEAAFKPRPVDLASDDRLIPLPGGRIAVAAQDLRAGDVVGGSTIVQLAGDEVNPYPPGTLVLLDKAAES